jgi:hypothetical protein
MSVLVPPPNSQVVIGDLALRRAAIQVAAGLPCDLKEALQVLDYARELVTEFLAKRAS